MSVSSSSRVDDTIAARSTPPGTGSVAIVRLSGSLSLSIAAALFHPVSGDAISDIPDRTLTLGHLRDSAEGDPIDECLLVLWRGPHSYTGEDVAELHLHGGPRIVDRALRAMYGQGARPAHPGEFTRRAFLNGRLDLAQAEAVADLIRAQTDRAARCALAQLNGGLSNRIESLRGQLVAATAEVEAHIDFPDEDLPDEDRARIGIALDDAIRTLDALLADARRGRPLREGIRIAIAGRPNAGKSSLLNALVGRERAIVAPHPGTTRDTIEAEIDLKGIPTLLVDMAGLRESSEAIEALGIRRAHEEIAAADLVVFLLDGTHPIDSTDREAFALLKDRPHVIAINKNDLPAVFSRGDVDREFPCRQTRVLVSLSAVTREGIAQLERAMIEAIGVETDVLLDDAAETPLVANSRHSALLESTRESVRCASEGLAGRLASELVAVDLRDALQSLGSITGHTDVSEALLDSIFSTFCIGK